MASQLGQSLKAGEEGSGAFDFEKWITRNGFQSIKDVFIEKDMNTLNTLTMENKNFSTLVSDYLVLQNTDVIPKSIAAMQELKEKRDSEGAKVSAVSQSVSMNKKEDMILNQAKHQ